jgi:hypothetical protein
MAFQMMNTDRREFNAAASALAKLAPTSNAPAKPGPWV